MYLLWIMAAFLLLYLVRVVRGPSLWDRLLSMNLVSTKIIIIIVAFASLQETSFLLDVSIVYALVGFVGVIFISCFLLERTRVKEPAGDSSVRDGVSEAIKRKDEAK